MIDELGDPPLKGSRDRDVVEHRQVLDKLAQSHASGVWADRHTELGSHEDDRKVFVHASEATTVNLAEADRAGLKQLFEHDAVCTVLTGRDTNGAHGRRNSRVAEHVIRTRGFFDPVQVESGQSAHARDGLFDVPPLVGVDHQRSIRTDRLAHERNTTIVVRGRRPDLDLEVRPAFGERVGAGLDDPLVRIPNPAGRGRIRGVSRCQQLLRSRELRRLFVGQHLERLVRCQRVGDVAKVDAMNDLSGSHVRQQLPERLAFGLGVQVPDGIDDGGHRQVDDAFFRTKPPQLRIARQSPPEPAQVCDQVLERPADYQITMSVDCGHAHLIAAANRKGQPVAFERTIGLEDDIGR